MTTKNVIYSISSPSGNRYIGSARNFEKRKREHLSALRRGKHHSAALQRAWAKYGDLKFSVLLICADGDLFFYEQLLLDEFKPAYNVNPSAVGARGLKWSDKSKAKIKGIRRSDPKSISAGILRETTPEQRHQRSVYARSQWTESSTKALISKLTGRSLSDEHKSNIGAGHLGQKRTEEAKASMSRAQSTRYENPEERMKASQRRKGIIFSPEHIENICKYQRNRPKEPRLGKKGGGGKPVICVETDATFRSMGLATDWLKSTGKSKAIDCSSAISLACNGHREKAFGFTWRFAESVSAARR